MDLWILWHPAKCADLFPQPNWNNFGGYGDEISLVDSNGCNSGISISWYAWGMWHTATYGPQNATPQYPLATQYTELQINGRLIPESGL